MEYAEWCIVLLSCVSLSSGCGILPFNSITKVVNPKEKYNDGDKVLYICAEDYEVVSGRRSIQCVDGKWSELTLQCQKRSCGHVELPNGRVDYSVGNSVGDKAQATCDNGYTLRGTKEMVCTRTGWSGIPSCGKGVAPIVTCLDALVTNGDITGGAASVYQPGASVTFTCSQGFSLTGSQQITCGEDGQWQPQPPRCNKSKRVLCTELNIPNSRYRKNKKAGSEIDIKCNKGFQRSSGAARVVCSEQGKWVGEIPTCSPALPVRDLPIHDCSEPEHVANFNLKDQYRGQTSFPDGYRVRYECNLGYSWSGGSSSRTCTGGRWTDLQMLCERKSCGSAGEVLNGQFIYSGNQFGDSATAVCDEGYLLVGRPVRRCMNEGWDGREAVCHAVHCNEPAESPNTVRSGTIQAPYVHSSVINYRCRVGSLIGQSSIYCTKDGAWSAEPPECKDVSCAIPRFPNASRTMPLRNRYKFRDMVTFRCHQSRSVHAVTCGQDGNWSPLPC